MQTLGPNTSFFTQQTIRPVVETWKYVNVVQMHTSGTAIPNTLYSINSLTDYKALSGPRSHGRQVIETFRKIYSTQPTLAIFIAPNVAGVAPTTSRTFTGAATANIQKTYRFIEHSKSYTISILTGDTATVIAQKLKAQIDLDTDCLFTAAESSGVLTLTCSVAGTLYNNALHMSDDVEIPGITETFTAWAGGANDPVLTTSIFESIIGQERCKLHVPYYAFNVATTYMLTKVNVQNNILSGSVISFYRDTKANVLSSAYNNNSIISILNTEYISTMNTSYIKGSGRFSRESIYTSGAEEFAFYQKQEQPTEYIGDNRENSIEYGLTGGIFQLRRDTRDIKITTAVPHNIMDKLTPVEVDELKQKGYSTYKYWKDGNMIVTDDRITTAYPSQTLQGRYGVFSHLNTVNMIQYIQGYLFAKVSNFLSNKGIGGINSTNDKDINEDKLKGFVQQEMLTLMTDPAYQLLTDFSEKRVLDNASYKDIFDNKVKSEQGFSMTGTLGNITTRIPLVLPQHINSFIGVLETQYIN